MFEIKVTVAFPDLLKISELLAETVRQAAEAEINKLRQNYPRNLCDRPALAACEQNPAAPALATGETAGRIATPPAEARNNGIAPGSKTRAPGGSPEPEGFPPHNAPASPVLPRVPSQPQPQQTTVPVTAPTTAPALAPTVPTVPVAPAVPAAAPTIPAPAPAVAPTAAPSFSLAQIAKAGADLLTANPSLQPTLVDLIRRYGCQTVQELTPDKLPAFAAELRQMGARI